MSRRDAIDDALGIDDLRASFLRYTREAYARLPAMVCPRILDIGCGSGLPTIELARLSTGEIIGVDTNASLLAKLHLRVAAAGLGKHVLAVNASLLDNDLPKESFDILWDEGVLHLYDVSAGLFACRHLLRPEGHLVMHETIEWFKSNRERIEALGFILVDEVPMPGHCWWTDYYAPLERRVRALRAANRDDVASADVEPYEREIAMVKADPGRFDCGFFIVTPVAGGLGPC